jgi:hypothetical protein
MIQKTGHQTEPGTSFICKKLAYEGFILPGIATSYRRSLNITIQHHRYLNQYTTVYTTPARDNAVLSYDLRINIPEQKTVIGAEVSGSLLNYNTIPGPITQAELEEYTGEDSFVDPAEYANLFVFNKNMEPFIPGRANLLADVSQSYF